MELFNCTYAIFHHGPTALKYMQINVGRLNAPHMLPAKPPYITGGHPQTQTRDTRILVDESMSTSSKVDAVGHSDVLYRP